MSEEVEETKPRFSIGSEVVKKARLRNLIAISIVGAWLYAVMSGMLPAESLETVALGTIFVWLYKETEVE